jgi:hypothetical protein
LPFSIFVTNPVHRISITRQPEGSVDTAVSLTVQPRLSITSSGPSLEGQRVRAMADASCTSGVSVLFDTCVVLADSTCEFRGLAVIGVNREVEHLLYNFWWRIFTNNFVIRFEFFGDYRHNVLNRVLKKFALGFRYSESHRLCLMPSM